MACLSLGADNKTLFNVKTLDSKALKIYTKTRKYCCNIYKVLIKRSSFKSVYSC